MSKRVKSEERKTKGEETLIDGILELELSSDGSGDELGGVGVGEETRRVGLDLGERETGCGIG